MSLPPFRSLITLALLLLACQTQSATLNPSLVADLSRPAAMALRANLASRPLPHPDGLRPCCAFGYNLQAKLFGVPVPGFRLNNVVAANKTGQHHYNPGLIDALPGLNGERNGLIYTRLGGFIDLAHLRDSADNTLWLFSQIWAHMGKATTLELTDELGQRRIELLAFTPPGKLVERYQLSVILAAHLAFEIAAWHEIAQWYGYQSVPGYSEGVSAFSPEDLYSNLLGTRIAIDLLNAGEGASVVRFERAMRRAIPQALSQLQAVSPSGTRFYFDMLDRLWWNSDCRLPDKFLLRYRDYNVRDKRIPSRPYERPPALRLTLPDHFHRVPLSTFGRLEILPAQSGTPLPFSATRYLFADFPELSERAENADMNTLSKLGFRCN